MSHLGKVILVEKGVLPLAVQKIWKVPFAIKQIYEKAETPLLHFSVFQMIFQQHHKKNDAKHIFCIRPRRQYLGHLQALLQKLRIWRNMDKQAFLPIILARGSMLSCSLETTHLTLPGSKNSQNAVLEKVSRWSKPNFLYDNDSQI